MISTVYLRHLRNADKMIADLCSAYRQIDQASCLCFYGDHIPSMPKIYQELDYNDQDSDYFIWHNSANDNDFDSELVEKSISVDALAKTLLGLSGNLNHEKNT